MGYTMYKNKYLILLGGILLIYTPYVHTQPIKKNRSSSYPFIAGDTFRAIADHIIDETKQPFNPEDVQKGDIIFLKTDYVPHFFASLHPRIPNPYILLTHNSDFSPIFRKTIDHPWRGHTFENYLNDPKIIVWFAQNIDLAHPKLKTLPLGIANNYWKHGNIGTFQHAMKLPIKFEEKLHRIYVNFTIRTNPNERKKALNFSKQFSLCDIIHPKNFGQYLEDVKKYRFILSPPGNGIDCHRTWEAILMGSIPIMKHSLLDSLYEGLPVIFVHNWSEITTDFLDNNYKKIMQTTYYPERMFADYWIDLIMSYKNI